MYKCKLSCFEFDLSLTKIRFSIKNQYRKIEIRLSTKNNPGPRPRPRPRRANTSQDDRQTEQQVKTHRRPRRDRTTSTKEKNNKPKNQHNSHGRKNQIFVVLAGIDRAPLGKTAKCSVRNHSPPKCEG